MPNPSTTNISSINNVEMVISRCPNVTFNLTTIPLPTVSIGPTTIPTSAGDYPVPSNKATYDPMTVEFIVDENFDSYVEILNWINEMKTGLNGKLDGLLSDIHVRILSNSKVPLKTFVFHDAFPTILNEVQLGYSQGDDTPIICSATFHYAWFDLAV